MDVNRGRKGEGLRWRIVHSSRSGWCVGSFWVEGHARSRQQVCVLEKLPRMHQLTYPPLGLLGPWSTLIALSALPLHPPTSQKIPFPAPLSARNYSFSLSPPPLSFSFTFSLSPSLPPSPSPQPHTHTTHTHTHTQGSGNCRL